MLLGNNGGVPEVPFASSYQPAEIGALGRALKTCYGSDEAARRAVEQNNQVLCPVYATPELLLQTNAALIKLVGKREALEILLMNPAVLTCGARGIAEQDPAKIRSTASTRQALDRVTTPTGLALSLLLLGFLRVAFLSVSNFFRPKGSPRLAEATQSHARRERDRYIQFVACGLPCGNEVLDATIPVQ
jgi:hypothetical protein